MKPQEKAKNMDDAMRERLGEEGYKEWKSKIGRKGGSKTNPKKGFGSDPRRAQLAGKMSGYARRAKRRAGRTR